MTARPILTLLLRRVRCWFRHDWRTIDSPEPMYPGVSEWAGTKECRRCGRFAYWSAKETAAYVEETPWKQW